MILLTYGDKRTEVTVTINWCIFYSKSSVVEKKLFDYGLALLTLLHPSEGPISPKGLSLQVCMCVCVCVCVCGGGGLRPTFQQFTVPPFPKTSNILLTIFSIFSPVEIEIRSEKEIFEAFRIFNLRFNCEKGLSRDGLIPVTLETE